MKIYDEVTREEVLTPDLKLGFLYTGTIVVGQTEPEVVVMPGTVTEDRPEGLREYKPAQDIVEECKWYHKYTDEELEAMNPGTDGDTEKRISALEEELQAAKILLGVE